MKKEFFWAGLGAICFFCGGMLAEALFFQPPQIVQRQDCIRAGQLRALVWDYRHQLCPVRKPRPVEIPEEEK